MPGRTLNAALCLGLALVCGACGTTVNGTGGLTAAPDAAQADGQVGTNTGLGGPARPTTVTPGGSAATATSQPVGVLGRAADTGSRSDLSSLSSTTSGATSSSKLAPIIIGVELEKNGAATAAAFGVDTEPSTADPQTVYAAIKKFINSRGGIGGHPVEFVMHFTDLNTGTFDQQAQAACADFTEDHHVTVAITSVTRSTNLQACLTAHHVPLFVYRMEYQLSQAQIGGANADYIYAPLALNYEHIKSLVDGLWSMGFFMKGAKIGVLATDNAQGKAIVANVVKPALAAHGLKVDAEVYFYVPETLGGMGRSAADIQSAVLQFKSAGITHVLFASTAGVGPTFFQPAAESQDYHPYYGMGSFDFPGQMKQTSPAAQLAKVWGISWVPAALAEPAENPKLNADQKACRKAVLDAGGREATASGACDPEFMMDQALRSVPASVNVTPRGLREGMEAMGRSFQSYYEHEMVYEPGRSHDGAGGYRYYRYYTACSCYKQYGPVTRIP